MFWIFSLGILTSYANYPCISIFKMLSYWWSHPVLSLSPSEEFSTCSLPALVTQHRRGHQVTLTLQCGEQSTNWIGWFLTCCPFAHWENTRYYYCTCKLFLHHVPLELSALNTPLSIRVHGWEKLCDACQYNLHWGLFAYKKQNCPDRQNAADNRTAVWIAHPSLCHCHCSWVLDILQTHLDCLFCTAILVCGFLFFFFCPEIVNI